MNFSVFLVFEKRAFKIPISGSSNVPHLRQVEQLFQKRVSEDSLLAQRLSRIKFDGFIFQICDPAWGGRKRDLDSSDVLSSNEEIYVDFVVFDSAGNENVTVCQRNGNGNSAETDCTTVPLHEGVKDPEDQLSTSVVQFAVTVNDKACSSERDGKSCGIDEGDLMHTSNTTESSGNIDFHNDDLTENLDLEEEILSLIPDVQSPSVQSDVMSTSSQCPTPLSCADSPAPTKLQESLPLPIPFPLPPMKQLPEYIQQSLSGPKVLHPKTIAHFIRIICHEINKYSQAPSRRELDCLSKQIVDVWPKLKSDSSKNDFDEIRSKLRQRLKDVRYWSRKKAAQLNTAKDTLGEVPSAKKTKVSGDRSGGPKDVKSDVLPTAEELISYPKSVKIMQDAKDKTSSEVTRLMADTYPIRRQKIEEGVLISSVLEEFPALREKTQIMKEFERVLKKEGIVVVVQDNWNKYLQPLLKIARQETNPFIVSEFRRFDAVDNPNSYHASKLLLQVLPRMLFLKKCGNPENYVFQAFQEHHSIEEAASLVPGRNEPFVMEVGGSQLYIVLEQEVFLKLDTCNVPDALAILIACYYVFNIEYPKQANGFYFFLQEIILEYPKGEIQKGAQLKYIREKLKSVLKPA